MKRFARFAPPLALLAVTLITALSLRWRAAQDQWQPLPGGGKVRVLAVTHGLQHSLELDAASWRERARMAWRARSLGPLTSRAISHTTLSIGKPSLVFWLEGRQTPNSKSNLLRGDLVLPDGQAFQDTGIGRDGVAGANGRWSFPLTFPIIPARARTVHLITRFNGGRQEFDLPNPAYRTDLPVWKAEPLPQAKFHGDVTLILNGVNIYGHLNGAPAPDPLVYWNAQPMWSVMHGKSRGEHLFAIDAFFEDPAGNVSRDMALFSEPVWKVRATITRGNDFPFVGEEERAIGAFEPFTFEFFIPAPERPNSSPGPPAPRNR